MIIWSKYFSYYLGLLWSDGHITRGTIYLSILKTDALEIKDNLEKIDFLKFCFYDSKRSGRKDQFRMNINNVKFYDDFISMYFKDKSNASPDKLLNIIPIEFKRYFFLGLIDGDGCFSINKKGQDRKLRIASTYDQDWNYLLSMSKEIGITKAKINRIIRNSVNKYSIFTISDYDDLVKIIHFLYPNGFEFGLKRKYNKAKHILDKLVTRQNHTKIDIFELSDMVENNNDIIFLSKHYNCHWQKIYSVCKKHDIKYKSGFFSNLSKKLEASNG